jgi:hypothetical protein
MQHMRIHITILSVLTLAFTQIYGQHHADTAMEPKEALAFARDISGRLYTLEDQFNKKLHKQKEKLMKQEARLTSAVTLADSSILYLLEKTKAGRVLENGRSYIPMLDSLGTSLSFLTSIGKLDKLELGATGDAIQRVRKSLQDAELFESQMQERLRLMKERLLQMGKLNEVRKLQEKIYYYRQQVEEYRQALDQPDKLIAKSLGLIQRMPYFRDFFSKHSQLASMFMLPGSASMNDPNMLNGLQTVVGMQNLLQQRFGISGSTLQSQVQAPSPSIQQLADQLKDKLGLKNGHEALEEMPDFKPDPMRNKSFWKRMEFGSNIQAQRANLFPATLDIALTAAYQVSERNSMGVGVSYKLGLGEVFKNIRFSHQGLGLRSFIDFQWKGNLFFSGGFEMNYREQIHSMADLKDRSAWQQSGLLGLSRKFKAGNKLTGRVQFLWDFLSYQQVPRSQPFLFRFGYTFNK